MSVNGSNNEFGVYVTTTAAAARAVEMATAKRAALKEADERSAERRGEVKQVRKLDGLGLLHKAGELTDDMFRVGLSYQRAFVLASGMTGKNPLNQEPSGSVENAIDAIVDAGRLVAACEACCTTIGEKTAIRSILGLGASVRSLASGRKHRELTDLVVAVLQKMVDARL